LRQGWLLFTGSCTARGIIVLSLLLVATSFFS